MKTKTLVKRIVFFIVLILVLVLAYLFLGQAPEMKERTWGITFSQKYSQLLGLDWKESYLALLDDLKVKNVRLIAYWDLIESEPGVYNFDDLEWQITRAEERGAKIVLVIGRKMPRWPECHEPGWVGSLPMAEQQDKIIKLLENVVIKYRNRSSILAWQVENEALFNFGNCAWQDKEFFKKEIKTVKALDSRPVLITDSGEFSFWLNSAQLADQIGITMYKKAYFKELGLNVDYYFPPVYYWRKALLINKIFNKKIIVAELQAEPWGREESYRIPLSEQLQTMDLERFKYNIEFAKKSGFDTFYLWGAEWWYYLKAKEQKPEIWEEARKLF